MQNNINAWPNTTKDKIRLSPTKSKPYYKLSRPPKATLHVQKQEVSPQTTMQVVATHTPKARNEAPKLITSKEQLLH